MPVSIGERKGPTCIGLFHSTITDKGDFNMKFMKICLAAALGFVGGARLFHTPPVNANPQDVGQTHVFIAPVDMLDAKSSASQNLPGARIAGISCIPKPQAKLPYAAVCYVATALQ
jgi:hypothetical protein